MIKHYALLLFTITLLAGCNTQTPKTEVAAVVHDTVVVTIHDTIAPKIIDTAKAENKAPEKQPLKVLEEPKKKPLVKATGSDTTFYYYKDGKVSVKITPWKDGNRYLLFYNRSGQLTYTQNDKRMSFTEVTQLSFKGNGSVEKAEIHENPGASMYWYETRVTFSDDNEPEWMVTQRMPVESLTDAAVSYYWNKKTRQWTKQEAQP